MAEEETKALPHYPNLRSVKSGEVRNPSGRNGKIGLGELREFLAERAEPASRHSRRENLLLALYTTAIDRRRRDHVPAARVLLAYDVGLPPQAIDVRNPDDSLRPKILEVRWVDAKHVEKSDAPVGDGNGNSASKAG
jgi:hypothetical protein